MCCPFISRLLEAARSYTLFDFAMLKVCLLTIGALFGAAMAKVKGWRWVAAILAIASYSYIMWRTFREFFPQEE